MRRALRSLAALAVLLACATGARAQQVEGPRIGVRLGAFFPMDEVIRDEFADVIPAIGLVAMQPIRPGSLRVYPALELYGARAGDDRFIVIPAFAVLEYQFPDADRRMVPYASLAAGIAYFDYRIHVDDTRIASRRGGAIGNAELGLIFTRHLRATARYRLTQEHDGLQFGGLEVSAVIGAI